MNIPIWILFLSHAIIGIICFVIGGKMGWKLHEEEEKREIINKA
jgi:hypothetical protein